MRSPQAIFDYKYQDPWEQAQLSALNLPPPPPKVEPPLKGTVDVPEHNFDKVREYIQDNLFFTHEILYSTVFTIINRWSEYADKLLVDVELPGFSLPCQLEEYRRHQASGPSTPLWAWACDDGKAVVRRENKGQLSWSLSIFQDVHRGLLAQKPDPDPPPASETLKVPIRPGQPGP